MPFRQAARYEHDQVHAMALLIPCPLDRPPHQRLGLAQRHGATTSRSRVRPRPSWASGMKPGGNADRGSREAAEAITGGTECDQCGDACGSSELAVCRSRGCGVKFAQCARCGTEYDGCCSDACQALVADPARNIMNNEGVTSPVGQRRRSELVSPDEAESWDKVVGSFGRRAGVPVDRTATVQPNAVETEDDRKRGGVGGVLSNGAVASARGPLNGARNEVATGFKAEKGEKTQKEEKVKEEEPVLESYASRHSAPESSCLAGVREATTRCEACFNDATRIAAAVPFNSELFRWQYSPKTCTTSCAREMVCASALQYAAVECHVRRAWSCAASRVPPAPRPE